MGVFTRPDSPWFYLWLERPGLQGFKEKTTIRNRPENAPLAQEVYERRMSELARGQYCPPPPAPIRRHTKTLRADGSGWCYVYFVWNGELIKIGRAVNVLSRMRAMQTAHATPLQLLAVFPCHISLERLIHRFFAPYRESGEWFRPDPEVIRFIESIVSGKDPTTKLVNRSLNIPATFADFKIDAKRLRDHAALVKTS